jgi:hypothetical protein
MAKEKNLAEQALREFEKEAGLDGSSGIKSLPAPRSNVTVPAPR